MNAIFEFFSDYTIRTVVFGALVIGMVSGMLGSLVVLRKQSLLGDAMSHAALPGIALAFLLTGSKSSIFLMIGAALSAWFASFLIFVVVNNSRIKFDGALAMWLSVFFGFGVVFLTIIQHRPDSSQAGLETFLFGQAAALTWHDVKVMQVVGGISILLLLVFWKEFKITTFDPEFALTSGFRTKIVDIFIISLVVIAIVIGLQMVGVVLMSSMIVAPGVAARQWTDRVGKMIILSGIFGAISGLSGAIISSQITRLPTGPSIVVVATVIVFISFLISPVHGVISHYIEKRRVSKKLKLDIVLEGLYTLASRHKDPYYPHKATVLRLMFSEDLDISATLSELSKRGLVKKVAPDHWALTDKGISYIQKLREDKREH